MASDQAMRASDSDRERASSAGRGMRSNGNRRVITSTDEFLDAGRAGGILPILVRPGAIHAELLGNIMRARKEVYRHASVLRHTLNHQQRKEPSSADEVLP
jgi:hypothetical protein